MAQLFESATIGSMTVENRFVRSATWEALADDGGGCTPELTETMTRLARGGVGLIISGHAYVSREGQAGPRQLAVDNDSRIGGLKEMTGAVHQAGGKIVLQLAHAGCHASEKLSGVSPVGPSKLENEKVAGAREASPEDFERIIDAFAQAASRARDAGFDGVQIHAAHGYFLSQTLSPFYNQRTDDMGGSLENRARTVLAVLKAIRERVGTDFPVLVKINSEDFIDGGLTREESLRVAAWLAEAGIDAVELSGGTQFSGNMTPVRRGRAANAEEAWYQYAARELKSRIGVPVMLVGGIRSYEAAAQLVREGFTDFVSLCRPLIREPELINRWRSVDTAKSECVSDNKCFTPTARGEGVYCVTLEGGGEA